MVAHIKTLLLVLFSIAVPVRITSASALSTWCASKGTQAWYLGQSCYTLTTTSKSYVDNANTACTERVNGGVAMLTTTDIIKSVCTNLLSKSSNALWFIAFVQILQSDHAGKNDDWFWVDSKNNTYGRCPDATWASGEPDDQPPQADGLDHNYENCVVIEKTGIMRDTGCTGSFFPAICQYREPSFDYQTKNIGNKVKSTSAALISGKVEISVETTEWCAIMCKTYITCRAFSINKSLITCTLLFKYDLTEADFEPNSDYETYGLY